MYKIRELSTNAVLALEQGEKLYEQWSKEEIIDEIFAVFEECEIEPEFSREDIEKVSEHVLRENLLKKSSWHHVNRKPTWFYVMNYNTALNLYRRDIAQMCSKSRTIDSKRFKPQLMNVNLTVWETRNNHEYAYTVKKTAVVYDGHVYFRNGSRLPVRDGVCTCDSNCGSIVKEKRDIFEVIIRNMRKTYCIAI